MGGTQMPTYISLVNLTEQGIKEVKNAPERLRFFDDAAKAAGGRLIGFYLVMGQFDYVVITEAPDDQTAARLIVGKDSAYQSFRVVTRQPVIFQVQMLNHHIGYESSKLGAVNCDRFALFLSVCLQHI